MYNESINEFIDWVDGHNLLTGDSGLQDNVSGGKIRELLQNKLQKPIYVYKDDQAKLYRIFSSESAKQLWESNPNDPVYKNLELAHFTAPSEYTVEMNLDTSNGSEVRYIRDGISGQSGSTISFDWAVKKDTGGTFTESIYVTFTFQRTGESFSRTIESSNKNVSIDVFKYLVSGENKITISAKGATTGSEGQLDITINTITLNIEITNLKIEKYLPLNSNLRLDLKANRNVTGNLNYHIQTQYYGIRTFGSSSNNDVIVKNFEKSIGENNINDLTPTTTYNGEKLESGIYIIQVIGEMSIDDKSFFSNRLYYVVGVQKDNDDFSGCNDIITFNYNYDDITLKTFIDYTDFQINLTQYEKKIFDWAYVRLSNGSQEKLLKWYIVQENISDANDVVKNYLSEFNQSSGTKGQLVFSPNTYTQEGYKNYLIAETSSGTRLILIKIPIVINKTKLEIGETTGALLKLSAFGKSNNNSLKDQWTYENYSTTFTGVAWNEASGWYNGSLRLSGINSYATINYNPFNQLDMDTSGFTVEIEFESEYVSNNSDKLVVIGSNNNSGTSIVIYPNKASLYLGSTECIVTNYKANEKVKLAFIAYPEESVQDELKRTIFIVNNGICERAAAWPEATISESFETAGGNIKIGGSASGIRVYNIRCYKNALTILNAYDNFVFDSDNKDEIVQRNNIFTNNVVDLPKCIDKMDVIKIEGSLSNILSRSTLKDNSNSTCNIERICQKDKRKNFKVTNGRIRKHGQSTLNYPLTSYKLWFNQSTDGSETSLGIHEDLEPGKFTKNRYQMIEDSDNQSIPSNKFVLQANYADSSGVHNGGLLRLIQETWYNANFGTIQNPEYKLRTPPQLFSSNQTIQMQQGDTTDENSEAGRIFRGYNASGKQWKDYFPDKPFPYTIRNAPNSFPCLVFYKNTDTGDNEYTLLGQYVFMDDKKSDFVYGERSIYKAENKQLNISNYDDPFLMKINSETGNAVWDEKDATKIWDNKHVLRIEVLSVSSTLADYRGYIADNSKRRFDDFQIGNGTYEGTSLGWEEDFELVYPDKEDITQKVGGVKQFSPTKFRDTVQPFTDWLNWLIGTYNNQAEFEATAASHLDLYKIAAYYIFVLRYGLVDSLERNAQVKTYDGIHFHYEPWDMDIALGNRNTGGIAFNPPIDRNTKMDDKTAAISGRSWVDTDNDNVPDTMLSNWLFDALENWDYFMNTIVKETADALYEAGLTYLKSIDMFDKEYQDKWCERIYNYSGNFKYVVNRQKVNPDTNAIIPGEYDNSWLAWLQGARTTHRHWWLKTSMDYYDAKWGVGEFTKKRVYLACEMHNVQTSINIIPTADTYFSFTREADTYGPFEASAEHGLQFSVANINSGAKVPFYINGANFIKELDISGIADGLQVLNLSNVYSEDVGPVITKLNAGVRTTFVNNNPNQMEGGYNGKDVTFSPGQALNAVEELSIRGQHGRISISFLEDVKTIKKLYAAGAGISGLSTAIGTNFEELELPDTIPSLIFTSTSWSPINLSFWSVTPGSSETIHNVYDPPIIDEETGETITEEDVIVYTGTRYDKYELPDISNLPNSSLRNRITTSIPRNLNSVVFKGTTASNTCAEQFIIDWIYSIVIQCTYDWNTNPSDYYETAHEYNTLDEYIEATIKPKTLKIEQIRDWTNLTFQDLAYMAMFNNIDYENGGSNKSNFNGRVVLNQRLTGTQTAQLSTWFGEDVFSLNGTGLIIDSEIDFTALTVGPDAYTINDQIYLKEGKQARLLSTKFKLSQNTDKQDFTFISVEGNSNLGSQVFYPNSNYPATCRISEQQEDDEFYYYLITNPNVNGDDYDVKIKSGTATQIIHIKAPEYPQDIQLGIEEIANNNLTDPKANDHTTSNMLYYKKIGCYVTNSNKANIVLGLQFKENDKFYYDTQNADLKDNISVKFKIYRNGQVDSAFENGIDYQDFQNTGSGNPIAKSTFGGQNLQYVINYRENTPYKYYIPLQIVPDSELKCYTIKAEVKIGGKMHTISQDIVVCTIVNVALAGTPQWGLINKGYKDTFGESFNYTTNFNNAICYFIEGTVGVEGTYQLNNEIVTVADNINSLTDLISVGKSIFKYLPNITGIDLRNFTGQSSVNLGYDVANIDLSENTKLTNIDLSGCQNLTDLPNFSNLSQLRSLNLSRCYNLSGESDLSNCINIESIITTSSSVDIKLPKNTKVQTLKLGDVSYLDIDGASNLILQNFEISGYSRLKDISIKNINGGMNYRLFSMLKPNTSMIENISITTNYEDLGNSNVCGTLYKILTNNVIESSELYGQIHVNKEYFKIVNYINNTFETFKILTNTVFDVVEYIRTRTSGAYIKNVPINASANSKGQYKFICHGPGYVRSGDQAYQGSQTVFDNSTGNIRVYGYQGTDTNANGKVCTRNIFSSSQWNFSFGYIGSLIEGESEFFHSVSTLDFFCKQDSWWGDVQFYYFRIYDSNDVLKHEYVPVLCDDRQCGIYDKVNMVYYNLYSNLEHGEYVSEE